jgi:transposase
VKQINLNQSVIKECEKEIKKNLGDIPESLKPGELLEEPKSAEEKLQQDFVLINSINGIGDWGAAALLAFGGDISRFLTFERFNAFTGTCPRYSRSGINDKVPGTMSKKGNKKLRWLMYMLVLSASRYNSIIKKYYQKQLSKGKCKKKALGACMSKLLRLVYGVIKTRRIFDPNYLENKRGIIGGEIASKA